MTFRNVGSYRSTFKFDYSVISLNIGCTGCHDGVRLVHIVHFGSYGSVPVDSSPILPQGFVPLDNLLTMWDITFPHPQRRAIIGSNTIFICHNPVRSIDIILFGLCSLSPMDSGPIGQSLDNVGRYTGPYISKNRINVKSDSQLHHDNFFS